MIVGLNMEDNGEIEMMRDCANGRNGPDETAKKYVLS